MVEIPRNDLACGVHSCFLKGNSTYYLKIAIKQISNRENFVNFWQLC